MGDGGSGHLGSLRVQDGRPVPPALRRGITEHRVALEDGSGCYGRSGKIQSRSGGYSVGVEQASRVPRGEGSRGSAGWPRAAVHRPTAEPAVSGVPLGIDCERPAASHHAVGSGSV